VKLMKYKSIVVTERGGPEKLAIVENDLRLPEGGEARIKILAAAVVQDDIAARVGNRPVLPKPPFVPGYACLGIVDSIGEDVINIAAGDRVAALANYGSHAEYIYWKASELVHVPESLDPAKAVTLILNYLVAYQTLHRVAKVKPGDKILIVGASGGCGTAYLQLGKLAGLKMYGLASSGKHDILRKYGAVPIDYRTQDFVEVIREMEPKGLDYVFNGMADEYFKPCLAVLRRGGVLVHYGAPQSFVRLWVLVVKLLINNLLPNGKKIEGYGTHRLGIDLFKEDWGTLFKLLEEGEIDPIIAAQYSILEARKANDLLESGQVVGNVVLVTPELIS
jgi:NADPH:quinone reductase-like Zn-dependent oxidoreductase